MNFFETFPESSQLSTVLKKTIKMIGHHSLLRDMMGQSYPIYACTSAYHVHYLSVHVTFCGSSKHTEVESVEHIEQYHIKFGDKSHHLKRCGRKAFVELLFSWS